MAVGPILFERMNIAALLTEQRKALEDDTIAKLTEQVADHPFIINRIRALISYAKSPDFLRLGRDQLTG